MDFVNMRCVTWEAYKTGTPNPTDLYFISDKKVIYRGTELYTSGVEVWEATETLTAPADPVPGVLYIEKNTGKMSVYDAEGNAVVSVNPSQGGGGSGTGDITVDDTVTENGTNPVTSGAVYTYVKEQIQAAGGFIPTFTSLTWDKTEHVLTITKSDNTTSTIVLEGLGCSLQMNATTGVLSLLDAKGDVIGEGVNLGKDKFVQGGEYDPATKAIKLYFNEDHTDFLTIPVADLIDEYEGQESSTINLTILNHKISAAVRLSAAEGNLMKAKEDGLYVGAADIAAGVAGELIATTPNTTAPSETKTISEKTFVESMSWKYEM